MSPGFRAQPAWIWGVGKMDESLPLGFITWETPTLQTQLKD